MNTDLRIAKSKFEELIDYLLAIAIILETNSVWAAISIALRNAFKGVALILLVIAIIIRLTSIRPLSNLPRKFATLASPTIILFIATSLVYCLTLSTQGIVSYIIKSIAPFSLFYVYYCVRREVGQSIFGFFRKYAMCITVISVISVLLWIFMSQLHAIAPTGSISIEWGTAREIPTFLYIYFETQAVDFLNLGIIVRNDAIFTEAPMFSLHLCLALCIVVLPIKRKEQLTKGSILQIVILLLGVMTSFSTTGYIFCLLLFMAKGAVVIFEKKRNRSNALFSRILPTVFGVACIVGVVAIGVLFRDKLSLASGSSRMSDWANGVQSWLRFPLFGSGYTGVGNSGRAASDLVGIYNTTSNSVTEILTQCGILILLTGYIIPATKTITYSLREKKCELLIFVVCWLYLIVTTIFSYSFVMYAIISYFLFLEWREKETSSSHLGECK